jgi:iron complex transport system substrate-binding protein
VPTAIPAPTANLLEGCVSAYDAGLDYFPEKAAVQYSDGFTIEYFKNYKVLTVKTPFPGASESFQYVLVQCGTPKPTGFTEEQIIEVPVKTIVSLSTTYLPFLEKLGVLDRLVGLDDATFVSNETVAKLAAEGKLKILGNGAQVNVEQALDLNPDLIMAYSSGSPEFDAHPKLIEAGLKVAVNAEWLDTSPLGRAEWGKFIAAFFNREARAEKVFAETAQNYEKLKALAATAKTTPTAFAGTPYEGTWYMPGGQSFAAAFLTDAGASYLWADDASTGSLPLAVEAVYDKAKEADYWVNQGFVGDLKGLAEQDKRFTDFAAFKSGNVWNNDLRTNANGGNDYYEGAIANPDVVLADLIAIFHPELMPEHEFVYYRQVK